jgi:hypothetical protein
MNSKLRAYMDNLRILFIQDRFKLFVYLMTLFKLDRIYRVQKENHSG